MKPSTLPHKGTIELQLFEYWHTSAGHGKGRYFDAVVSRSEEGLPIIRGKTLRGLIREVVYHAECFGQLKEGTCEAMFGSSQEKLQNYENQEITRFTTRTGSFRVGSATLPQAWQAYAITKEGKERIKGLYDEFASTAINANGIAEEHTLRRIEVVVPLTLHAQWEVEASTLSEEELPSPHNVLQTALPLLRKLGSSRHRGLGRVQATLLDTDKSGGQS